MARHRTHTTVGKHYEFGQRIASARRRAGLSQEALADRIGATRRYVIKIENGEHVPRPERMDAINAALGSDIEAPSSDDEEDALAVLIRQAIEAAVDSRVAAILEARV